MESQRSQSEPTEGRGVRRSKNSARACNGVPRLPFCLRYFYYVHAEAKLYMNKKEFWAALDSDQLQFGEPLKKQKSVQGFMRRHPVLVMSLTVGVVVVWYFYGIKLVAGYAIRWIMSL